MMYWASWLLNLVGLQAFLALPMPESRKVHGLGEWVLANSNLISHTVRLNAYPTDKLTLTIDPSFQYVLANGGGGQNPHAPSRITVATA